MSFASQTVIIYPLPESALALPTVVNVLKATTCDVLALVPDVLNHLASDADALKFVSSRVNLITYAGGPASQAAAELVSERVRLTSTFGHTENGILPCVRPKRSETPWHPSLWRSFHFHPDAGIEMRKVPFEKSTGDHSNMHELFVRRHADPENKQPVFSMLPNDCQEWTSKDLFIPDPNHDTFWLYHGRTDDLLVFASGAKFDPNNYEKTIIAHPAVCTAVMVGTGRRHAILVVEPQTSVESAGERHSFLREIMPTIEKANDFCGPLSSISEDRLLVVPASKAMPKTGKGTVAKQEVLTEFATELDGLYGGH
ncbi:MAG: hypothetical protein Q9162_003469 [Coniocarpon cinnabarinum]